MLQHPSRRAMLMGLAAAGAAALLPSARILGQATGGGPRRIDVHHHFGSPHWIKDVVAVKKMSGYQTWEPYSPQKSIEDMDKGGVASSMISLTTPGIWFGADAETRGLARHLNEYGAKMVADYPGRFGLLAALPFPDTNACLEKSITHLAL